MEAGFQCKSQRRNDDDDDDDVILYDPQPIRVKTAEQTCFFIDETSVRRD
jgi:hypothetical protein